MVFSWIFPVCLRGTMLSSLLLLLSPVSAEIFTIQRKDFMMMMKETLKTKIVDSLPYGCLCVSSPSDQIMEVFHRCCSIHSCCNRNKRFCDQGPRNYSYTYINGTITCDYSVYQSGCARETCECDRKTVMCLMNLENSQKKQKKNKCYMKLAPCIATSQIVKLLFPKKNKNL
ncbi:basic phospholipase A2 homolog LmutTX-like isoform 1-T1 [Anomaloglossus baeobatrachus]|uniref:basic phospholipase A2 homolog LmutTX-like n=1 Tax=Anomaloglossus baeobatrachus TaxID=238106 RepID=UPI003F4F53BA